MVNAVTLTEQILKAFDLSYAESERLKPLILALAECVNDLADIISAECPYGEGGCYEREIQANGNEALTTFRQVLEGMGK